MRPDIEAIASLIPSRARLFDIGCGAGELLAHAQAQKQADARGIEIEPARVAECVAQGLAVVQGDADTDLRYYPDKAFDVVVLAKTLQATKAPKETLQEALRIGRQVIVSVPNFGYWENRFYLLLRGRMPVTKQLSYEWYNTPNIHFCTIHDFTALCQEIGCQIEASYYLNGSDVPTAFGKNSLRANILGKYGIFVLRK